MQYVTIDHLTFFPYSANLNMNYLNRQSTKIAIHSLISAFALSASHSLSAQDPNPSPWEITGAAGLSLSKGNSDNLSYTLQLLSTYKQDRVEAVLGADWFYAESNGTKNTDSFRVFGEYKCLLNDRFYLGTNASYLTDGVSDLDYRIDVSAVAGYYLLKDEVNQWSVEFGPGYAWQEQGGIQDDFMTLRFATRFEHQLASRSKLWLSAIYAPKVDDFGDYLLNIEAGIDTLLSDHWALRTAVRYTYDSTPAQGRKSGDTLLTIGLRYALGGFHEAAKSGRRTLKLGAAAPKSIQMGWSSSAAVTFSMAKGNADSLSAGMGYDTAYRKGSREFFLNGIYTYAEADGARSADVFLANVQYNRLLGERAFVSFGAGVLRDEIADVSYRFTPKVNLGYYLIKEDTMTLSFEVGPGYTFEEVGDVTDSYFTIVAAEKFVWKIGERMTFKQSVAANVSTSDSENYILLADALLDTDITENLAWRVAVNWTYDNAPAAARDKDDVTLSTGMAVKF